MTRSKLILGGFVLSMVCFSGCSDPAEDPATTPVNNGGTVGAGGSTGGTTTGGAGSGGIAAGGGGAGGVAAGGGGAGGVAAGGGGAGGVAAGGGGAGGVAAGGGGAGGVAAGGGGAGGGGAGGGGGGGAGGGGGEATQECQDYCTAMLDKCDGAFADEAACLTACEPLTANQVSCRTMHAGYSGDPGDDHCTKHALGMEMCQ